MLLMIFVMMGGLASWEVKDDLGLLTAYASLCPTGEVTFHGSFEIRQTKLSGPSIFTVKVIPLTPNKKYGLAIHLFGDCKDPGPHYNPEYNGHGEINEKASHLGDLGNMETDSLGRIYYRGLAERIAITGDRGVVGRVIALHELEDDLGKGEDRKQSRIDGGMGKIIACGVIGYSKPIKEKPVRRPAKEETTEAN